MQYANESVFRVRGKPYGFAAPWVYIESFKTHEEAEKYIKSLVMDYGPIKKSVWEYDKDGHYYGADGW